MPCNNRHLSNAQTANNLGSVLSMRVVMPSGPVRGPPGAPSVVGHHVTRLGQSVCGNLKVAPVPWISSTGRPAPRRAAMLRYKFGKISIAGIAYRLIGNDLSLSFPIAAPRTQGNWASRTAPAGVASRQGAAESLVPSAGFAATRSELQRASCCSTAQARRAKIPARGMRTQVGRLFNS
jgi:hypothetical protein